MLALIKNRLQKWGVHVKLELHLCKMCFVRNLQILKTNLMQLKGHLFGVNQIQ